MRWRLPSFCKYHEAMPDLIDYDFISAREGGRRTDGYVPAAAESKSGVTVATGFDLGARNLSDINQLGLDKTLVDKLRPYLGKQKKAATELLATSPLTLTAAETEQIDKAVKKKGEFKQQLQHPHEGAGPLFCKHHKNSGLFPQPRIIFRPALTNRYTIGSTSQEIAPRRVNWLLLRRVSYGRRLRLSRIA